MIDKCNSKSSGMLNMDDKIKCGLHDLRAVNI